MKNTITVYRFFLWICFAVVCGRSGTDYDCLCSLNINFAIYEHPSFRSSVIGYLLNRECKPTYHKFDSIGFIAVGHRHKLGFVEINPSLISRTCQGPFPVFEAVMTTPQTTTGKTTITTTTTTKTTPKPTTSTTSSTTTTTATTTTTTTTMITTTPKPTATTTMQRPSTATTPRPMIYTTTSTTRKTITFPTTRWTKATNAVPEGHVELCPPLSKNDIERNHGFLGQYGEFCYEYVPYQTQWKNAERHCNLVSSGHLTYFTREDEQDFVLRLLKSHNHNEDVWIGLTDSDVEGTWTWSSGANVTVRHFQKTFRWKSDHDHLLHDCVVLKSSGEWLDRPCGTQLLLGGGFGESHAYVCQYNLTSKPPSVFTGNPGGFIVG